MPMVGRMHAHHHHHPRHCTASPKRLLRKGSSYQRWIAAQIEQDDAARRIQTFLRTKLSPNSKVVNGPLGENAHMLTASVASCSSTVDSSASSSSDELEDEHHELEVFLWHGARVGLEFDTCPTTGFPRVVDDASCNDALPGMWHVRNGDFLVAINDCSTHSTAVSLEHIEQIVEGGMRPAILRFRRPRENEMEKSVMTRSRRMVSTARLAVQRQRDRLEQTLSYIIWREEDATLGIGLKPDKRRPYPIVSEVGTRGAVRRQAARSPVNVGDRWLSINHLDVAQLGVKTAVAMLECAPRPLVLTFRRSNPVPREPSSHDL